MFNFTTLTVYNAINTSGANQNLWDNSAASKHPSLRIGNTRFDAADISAIEIKAPSAEALASVSFDMSKIIPSTGNTTGRIVLYISLSMNNLDSFYSNDLVYKGKPLFVEFPVSSTDTAADVAARVKNIADKYLLFQTEEKILNVSAASGVVTFEGVNGYQIISKAILQKYDPEAINVDCCSKLGDYVDVITGVPVIYVVSSGEVKTKDSNDKQYYLDADGNETEVGSALVGIFPGLEAFGDYNWIIHNLRLPTLANTHVWAPTKNEMPVVGLNYTQFIITLVKERDGIMGEIVGARGTSVTTHVLYVAGDYHTSGTPAYTVYTKLNALKSSAIATTADTKLANPFGTSKSLVG